MFASKGRNRESVKAGQWQREGRPVEPGEILRDEFLKAHGVTQDDFANAIGMSRITVNQLINGRRSITAETALRLAKALKTSAEFWLNLQRAVDLYDAEKRLSSILDKVKPILE
jgi:antitoxin HigA-1